MDSSLDFISLDFISLSALPTPGGGCGNIYIHLAIPVKYDLGGFISDFKSCSLKLKFI